MTTNSLKEQIDKENSRSIEIKGGIHTGLFIKDQLRMRDDNNLSVKGMSTERFTYFVI